MSTETSYDPDCLLIPISKNTELLKNQPIKIEEGTPQIPLINLIKEVKHNKQTMPKSLKKSVWNRYKYIEITVGLTNNMNSKDNEPVNKISNRIV